jgi:type III pantothenate kinase
MILLVDIGNSRIKWALSDGAIFQAQGDAPHQGTHVAEAFSAAWGTLTAPRRVLVANVAGKAMAAALRAWVTAAWGLEVEFLVPRRKACGVTNAYVEPQRLGADRWSALIGAHKRVPGNVCVIDCGSAVTFDALDAKGQHLGGLIIPGLAMMHNALIQNTDGISKQAMAKGDSKVSVLARDTQGAVTGGAFYALIAVIDRVTADLAADLQAPLARVICGGDAERLLGLLAENYRHEPDLVLHGLSIIAESIE